MSSNFLDKIGIHGNLKKTLGSIVMLAIAGSAISGLPFFRFEYYSAYMATYHLTNTQMGVFSTVIGVCGIVSYLFGGVFADGRSIRKIITGSLVVTGVAGLFHLLPLNFYGLLIIYAVWGISTTFAFTPACVKAVRMLAGKEEQGKAYGFFEGTSSVAGAIVAMIALAIFNWGVNNAGQTVAAMKGAILFYSITNILMGILAWVLVKDSSIKLHTTNVSFKGIFEVLKNPVIWIICLVGFCNHVLCLSVYYYIPYATEIIGATVAFGAMMGIFRKWGGFVGDIAGGYIADKIGTGKLMLISYGTVLVCELIVFAVPSVPDWVGIIVVLFVLIYIFFSINMAMSWTMMSEGQIPVEYSGTAAGLVCTIGAIPELFVTVLAGRLIDTNPGITGYHYFFYFVAAVTTVGFLLLVVYNLYLKKQKRSGCATISDDAAKAACGCHSGAQTIDDDTAKAACGCHTGVQTIDDDTAKAACGCHTGAQVVDDEDE